MNASSLRLKPYLSLSEIGALCEAVFNSAVAKGLRMPFDVSTFMKYCSYAISHEVGAYARNGSMPTGIGNPIGFAGLLQNGVDLLIEGNARTKDGLYKSRRPCMWALFPSGIHGMYTKVNRKLALNYHLSLNEHPRNLEGTATDALVAICSYLDTCRWAWNVLEKSVKRTPSEQEVYAFHLHGYMLMTDYFYLKHGLKPLNRKNTLANVTARVRKQLESQSASAKRALANIGVS